MVTVVPISDFLKRAEVALENTCIAEKYNSLFLTYPCFKECPTQHHHCNTTNKFPYPQTNGSHHRKKINNNHKYPTHNSRKCARDPSRAIISYLNVINIDNYSRVYTKIRLLLDATNVASIVGDILQKCWTATIYVNVYIKLLTDINTIYDIKSTVFEVVSKNIERFEFKSNIPDSYELFCEKQKHKAFFLGLNITLIKLCKAELVSHKVLKDYATQFENRVLIEKEEYHLDITLHILLELCKSVQGIVSDPNSLALKIECEIPRLKFLIQELAETH